MVHLRLPDEELSFETRLLRLLLRVRYINIGWIGVVTTQGCLVGMSPTSSVMMAVPV